ncbi:hypothetical protein GCM10009000_044780 [Halobacterium noricense]|uniref:Uncharacterized protein n=1 Tax=Haladaptatus pallidirubidus TaxID=1008152 RepID=A0AAV3UFG4_9EURY
MIETGTLNATATNVIPVDWLGGCATATAVETTDARLAKRSTVVGRIAESGVYPRINDSDCRKISITGEDGE